MQSYLQEREFKKEPFTIPSDNGSTIKYQGEVLKGTNIPHGRGIRIEESEEIYSFMIGWFSSNLLCGQGKKILFRKSDP